MIVFRVLEVVALWWGRKLRSGLTVFAAGMALMGVGAVSYTPPTVQATRTTTLERSTVLTRTSFVTVHVKGRVLHRYDHVLVVYVPRTVFHTHTVPRRRIVVPAHVVRIRRREQPPPFGETSLIVGVTPPPETVTVPVTVTDVQTVTQLVPTTATVTATTTQTDTTTATVTITVPISPEGTP